MRMMSIWWLYWARFKIPLKKAFKNGKWMPAFILRSFVRSMCRGKDVKMSLCDIVCEHFLQVWAKALSFSCCCQCMLFSSFTFIYFRHFYRFALSVFVIKPHNFLPAFTMAPKHIVFRLMLCAHLSCWHDWHYSIVTKSGTLYSNYTKQNERCWLIFINCADKCKSVKHTHTHTPSHANGTKENEMKKKGWKRQADKGKRSSK